MNKQYVVNLLINISIAIFALWIFSRPDVGLDLFRFYFTIILFLAGLSFIVIYKNKEHNDTKALIQGSVLIILGIVFLVSPTLTSAALALLLIAWMAYEAFTNLMLAMTYRKYSISIWPSLIILSLVYLAMIYFIFQDLSLGSTILIKLISILIVVRSVFNILDIVAYKKVYESIEEEL